VLRLAAALLTGPRLAALLTVVARRLLVVWRAVLVAAVFVGTDLPLRGSETASVIPPVTQIYTWQRERIRDSRATSLVVCWVRECEPRFGRRRLRRRRTAAP
jgi:hypothetical protein